MLTAAYLLPAVRHRPIETSEVTILWRFINMFIIIIIINVKSVAWRLAVGYGDQLLTGRWSHSPTSRFPSSSTPVVINELVPDRTGALRHMSKEMGSDRQWNVSAATSRQCYISLISARWLNSTVAYNVYTLHTRLLSTGWCYAAHRSIRNKQTATNAEHEYLIGLCYLLAYNQPGQLSPPSLWGWWMSSNPCIMITRVETTKQQTRTAYCCLAADQSSWVRPWTADYRL